MTYWNVSRGKHVWNSHDIDRQIKEARGRKLRKMFPRFTAFEIRIEASEISGGLAKDMFEHDSISDDFKNWLTA